MFDGSHLSLIDPYILFYKAKMNICIIVPSRKIYATHNDFLLVLTYYLKNKVSFSCEKISEL